MYILHKSIDNDVVLCDGVDVMMVGWCSNNAMRKLPHRVGKEFDVSQT